MNNFALIGLAFILALMPVKADDLDDANAKFAAGRFGESTASYQDVLRQKGFSAPVLYNLGNSLFREGNLAQAILAYKRAQWLAPGDQDIAANLEYVQKQSGFTAIQPSGWEKYVDYSSASGWAWLASAAWFLFCLGYLMSRLWPRARGSLILPEIACAIVAIVSVAAILLHAGKSHQGVVMVKNAAALISPFPAAQTVFSPAPGETLVLHKTYHDYLWVSDATGHSGWMDKTQVARVVPD